MSEQTIKQAIAIKPNGQILQIGLPRPTEREYEFINSFVKSAEPWEAYINQVPEIIWSSADNSNYHTLEVNAVATMLIRTIYQNQIEPVRGNVLITGISEITSECVATLQPKNLELLMAYGTAVQGFLKVVENQFDVSLKKGE